MTTEITDMNWKSLVGGDKPVVIDFWAEWCGPCRMISPLIEEVAKEYEGKVIIGKANIDDNTNISVNFGIRNIPTLLFFKDGEMVDRHVGAIRKPELTEKINRLL
ncbi:MAG: thioredoxin [Bacteroidales bacterium]|jgi:thioredoxin 1|nr:thioredoxin [Bacteroidales bacterium]